MNILVYYESTCFPENSIDDSLCDVIVVLFYGES